MSEALALTDAAMRGALATLLLLVAGRLVCDRPAAPATLVGVVFAAGLCVQAFASLPAVEWNVGALWQAPLVAVSVGNAVLFWLFTLALFNDGWRPRPIHAAVWVAVAAVGAWHCLQPHALETALLRGLPLVFALLAMGNAIARWRGDLVERRRRLRAFVVVAGSLYTAIMVAARLAAPTGRLTPPTATLDIAMLLAIVSVMAWQLLRSSGSQLFALPDPPPAAPPLPDAADQRLARALQRLMAEEHAYRDEKLSVAGLAARLAVPEYRLRRHINQRLGHRNFNAFVNHYRLQMAESQLADPQRRELPVLSIALDAGFGSVGPFNRAFKAATGLTPTEFRRRKLAES